MCAGNSPQLISFHQTSPGPPANRGASNCFFQAAQCGLARSQSAPCLHWVMDSGLGDCQPIKASPGSGERKTEGGGRETKAYAVNLSIAGTKPFEGFMQCGFSVKMGLGSDGIIQVGKRVYDRPIYKKSGNLPRQHILVQTTGVEMGRES